MFTRWPFVRQCLLLAKATNFETVSEDLRKLCFEVYSGFGQTKLVEDAVGCSRRAEQKEHENAEPSRAHVWMAAVRSKVPPVVHNYPEVDAVDAGLHPSSSSWLEKDVFEPVFKRNEVTDPLGLRDVQGKNIKPTWPTYSAASIVQLWANMKVLQEICAEDKWSEVGNLWQSVIVDRNVLFGGRAILG
eukprot:3880641-Amphidinium_carterae.1